jgi:hypothetical protein
MPNDLAKRAAPTGSTVPFDHDGVVQQAELVGRNTCGDQFMLDLGRDDDYSIEPTNNAFVQRDEETLFEAIADPPVDRSDYRNGMQSRGKIRDHV